MARTIELNHTIENGMGMKKNGVCENRGFEKKNEIT